MENLFAIGATIQLNWTLNSIAGEAFSLSGHSYQLHISCGNENALATGVTHSGNVLSWTFRPTAAWKRGAYTLWLDVFANGTKIVTVTYPNAFHIISSTASDVQSVAVQTGSATLNLVSSLDFYRFAPVVPVAGDDGYWYVNGAKAVDGNGEYILTSHTLEYDENTRNLIIDKDRVDSEGNSIEQVITALADLDSYYQAAEGSADGSVAGDGSRWGSYKTAENARNTAAQNAETARQSAASAAEGSSAGSVAGDGSRWGEFKSAEAERETASETAIARANAAAEAAEHMVEIHQGPPGDDGDSAYEIAVQEGFVGTKDEWLASLDGSDGTGIDEVEQTETSIANGGTNKVRITLTDGTYFDIQIKNGSSSNGLFPTSSALAAACPSPKVGDYAFVGDGFPADIYVCETAGTWTDSGEDFDGGNVDLTDYAKKAELSQLEHIVHNLSGKYYGVFPTAGDLPEGDGVGYAYVGANEPFAIYNFDGTSWSDSGSEAIGIQGPQGNSGYTGAAGELEVVNNLEDGGPTAALSAEAGKLLARNMKLLYDSMGAAAFWGEKPVIDWSGNSVPVSLTLTNCTIDNIASSVPLGDSYEATITPDAGNILNNVVCTMNGEPQTVVNGYIYIEEVTGAIVISAAGINLDTVCYDGKTYRQIFETNNKLVSKGLSPGFDNGSYSPATVSAGSPAITSNEYDTPGYSVDCTSSGASSQLKIASITGIASVNLFMAARVKITSWTHGLVGIVHYSNTTVTLGRVTNGWETVSGILNEQGTNCFLGAFNQNGTAATLTGFLDSPVLILMSYFSTAPTIDKLNALYEEYINIKKAS